MGSGEGLVACRTAKVRPREVRMDPERWARIKSIFHEAAEQPAGLRASYVRSRCDGDEALAVEIEALLDAQDRDESFIESPAFYILTQSPNEPDYQVAGRLIGSYRVIRKIGS